MIMDSVSRVLSATAAALVSAILLPPWLYGPGL